MKLCTFTTESLWASIERTVIVTWLSGMSGPVRPNATTAILGLSVVIICGDDSPPPDAVVAAQGRSQTIENMGFANIASTVKLTVTPGFTPTGPSIIPMGPMLGRGTSGVTVKPSIFGGSCDVV